MSHDLNLPSPRCRSVQLSGGASLFVARSERHMPQLGVQRGSEDLGPVVRAPEGAVRKSVSSGSNLRSLARKMKPFIAGARLPGTRRAHDVPED